MAALSDREHLRRLVELWNESRLDLFHISLPTEDLEIEGVMRFYFQDGEERVLTKCVRVSSTASTKAVVEALAEKFLPDLKMLSDDQYSLWEVHENGTERRMDEEEKPLLVQLNWNRDDREGRFLLRRDRGPTIPLSTIQLQEQENTHHGQRYSKKEKQELRKKHQKEFVTVNGGREEPIYASSDIYQQLPESTFTRTISNPEVVMKKRRERKLESRLQELGRGQGGSLKVYGGELVPSRPYVTLLVSEHDRAEKVLAEVVEKYGLDNSGGEFVLVEIPMMGSRRGTDVDGRIIHPNENPLRLLACSENGEEEVSIAIRKAPSDYRVPASVLNNQTIPPSTPLYLPANRCTDPAFLVVSPDGSIGDSPQWISIRSGVTEVGSDQSLAEYSQQSQNIYIDGPDVCGRHCVITFMDGVVTITPSAAHAQIKVNGRSIAQTEILVHGDALLIGRSTHFLFSADKTMPPEKAISHENGYSFETTMSNLSGSSGSRQTSEQLDPKMSINSSLLGRQLLPISLQIGDYKVWDYLVEVISRGYEDAKSFRLAPAYSLYLALRFFQSHSKPYLGQFFSRIEFHMKQIAQECTSRDELLFWLANSSELFYLVEHTPDLKTRCGQLASVVEVIFRQLCTVLLGTLRPVCQRMLEIRYSTEEATDELIAQLDGTLRCARGCRLNAALTIQLSGHMFHAISATIFNSLVGLGPFSPVQLSTRLGDSLLRRIDLLHRWAERTGVELAAECHLDRCRQAAILLATQKNDVASLGATCYKLNSLQVKHLLSNFTVENGEIPCDEDVINRIVGLAERQADQLTIEDRMPLTLGESEHLQLPFILPQDGYAAEHVKSVPDGLLQYIYGLQNKGLCHSVNNGEQPPSPPQQPIPTPYDSMPMSARSAPMARSNSQSTLNSLQTNQFGDSFGSSVDEVIRVKIIRGSTGIGLSIVAAQGVGDRQTGIYVKKVVGGSAAAQDGRLSSGDQLLSVNGNSLLGVTQEEAAQLMARCGNEVYFEVRKGAANRNGLASWLGQATPNSQPSVSFAPSPAMSQSLHSGFSSSTHSNMAPPPYSNYANMSKYGSQQSVQSQTPSMYQQRSGAIGFSRQSAFAPPRAEVEPQRHVRSISASELYQNDPNASISQRSITSTTTGFDRLPAHYRQSGRPTVVQPARTCPSPSALRRGAQSPSNLYSGPSNGLYRPPSASNLFAPPRSPNPLQQQGYTSTSLKGSMQDLYRASMPSPPAAQSSPIGGGEHQYPGHGYASASLPATSRAYFPVARADVPRATVGPVYGQRQEPAIVRPNELGMPKRPETHPPPAPSLKSAVPTAISQTLALQAAQAGGAPSRVARPLSRPQMDSLDRDVMELERSSNMVMSRKSIDEELDRLDAKGINMTESEKQRYRQLLNIAAESSRSKDAERKEIPPVPAPLPAPIMAQRRTETLIDDVEPSVSATPPKKVQFFDEAMRASENIDSPGIVGANEIYLDPRQRRLQEINERQGFAGPDGAHLGFRDKMKMFAHQIGEDTPKQRANSSSAERYIQREQ